MAKEDATSQTWKEVILSTKGPSNIYDSLMLFIKGLFMGAANIIPGVSGGTIALITGIYQDLLFAIRSVNIQTLKHLKNFEVKHALSTIHIKFLFILGLGVAAAILSLAHVMNYVFVNYEVITWSFFFGLILASIVVMGIKTKSWLGSGGVAFVFGTVFAYVMVGLIPVSTPESWWFILLTGAAAICTMILPGLSGAFLLLILGKYEYITNALKKPFVAENFVVLCIFGAGCLLGIIAFSRILSYMLKRNENATMAMLTGIMCGSLRKVWPWKDVLETRVIRGKIHKVLEVNVLPKTIDTEVYVAVFLAVIGFVLVIVLERTAGNDNTTKTG